MVSVAGKRDFQGGEKIANTSPEAQIRGLRDEAVVQKPRRFGALRTPAGNLRTRRTAWWRAQSKSNPSPRPNSLLTGKRTGNFVEITAWCDFESRRASKFKGLQQNSLLNRTGNFCERTGNW